MLIPFGQDQNPSAPVVDLSWPKSLPILTRGNERLYHLGLLIVAVELIQLLQPEVVACRVRIRIIVRIAPQITKVIHKHERPIDLLLNQDRVLGYVAQCTRACSHVAGVHRSAKLGDDGIAICVCGRDPSMSKQAIRQLGWRDGVGINKSEASPEVHCEGALIILQHCLPTALSYDHPFVNSLGVEKELIKSHDGHCKNMRLRKRRHGSRIAESCFVDTLDEIAGLLEFD